MFRSALLIGLGLVGSGGMLVAPGYAQAQASLPSQGSTPLSVPRERATAPYEHGQEAELNARSRAVSELQAQHERASTQAQPSIERRMQENQARLNDLRQARQQHIDDMHASEQFRRNVYGGSGRHPEAGKTAVRSAHVQTPTILPGASPHASSTQH